ncbi:adenosylcobinamide-GDP ribazoletransferase [Novosphingobium chloroacetimidivorans]|uniref:Adenosylcobinamide-GDP ribazoletransferase n=1 Tax=Novosphingobium chloroacetimidivorans TaxID=1428314 RepID=A0A7W7K9Y5_9SPHN|nr:adenosylcobinamide-GDP ribazoletransferase [Novosphingobium chloroacetimidivorans]MBB4858911.1 adenosylcobinamide-GDP ribazoletransferase [Novosphingobium chloroacetimidivorans]
MKALVLALQFMTRLPLPQFAAEPRHMAAAIRWFPAAGIVIGACVAAAGWIGLQSDSWAGALLALLAWVAITGALHLDGLGDIADAAGAAHGDRSRISTVLADPHIGSFGVVAIALQLVSKLVLCRLALEGPLLPLILIPTTARVGPLLWTLTLPPLHQGLGSTFGAGASWSAAGSWLLVLGAMGAALAPASLLALPAFALWGWWLRQRIGGISGDGHGAGIELVETAMLAALAFAA